MQVEFGGSAVKRRVEAESRNKLPAIDTRNGDRYGYDKRTSSMREKSSASSMQKRCLGPMKH